MNFVSLDLSLVFASFLVDAVLAFLGLQKTTAEARCRTLAGSCCACVESLERGLKSSLAWILEEDP